MVISGGINHQHRWVVIAVLLLRESVLVFGGVLEPGYGPSCFGDASDWQLDTSWGMYIIKGQL